MFHKAALSLYLLFLSLGFVSAQEQYDPYQTYTLEELQEDYDEVVKALLAVHPGLLSFQTFREFRYIATVSRGELQDNMTENDFYKILSGMVSHIRCGHTFVLPSMESVTYYKDKAIHFPLVINVEKGEAYITEAFREADKGLEGQKLMSVNGFDWKTIRDSLWHYIPADGYIPTRKDFLLSQNFEFFYRVFFGTPPSFKIQTRDTTVALTTLSYEEMSQGTKEQLEIKSTFHEDSVYLKVNTFSESKTYKKEVKKNLKKIIRKNPSKLTIDLRENDGGSTENMIYMLAFLLEEPFAIFDTIKVHNKSSLESFFKDKKQVKHYVEQIKYDSLSEQFYWDDEHNLAFHSPRKKTYQGQITVLMGGGTFSSAVHFIACLQNAEDIHMEGEETGGFADHNNGGVIPKIVLPNTKVRFSIPLFQGKYHVEFDVERGRGIFPELENKAAFKD